MSERRQAIIAMGGNQGNVAATLQTAAQLLSEHPQIQEIHLSGFYGTAPIGDQAGEGFLNAVASCQTTLPPEELLTFCQQIENQLGRVRTLHWGPRTLDLDLIAVGELVQETPRLTLPHPAAWYRRFVLDPLCEVAAESRHPERDCCWRDLRDRLCPLPLILDLSLLPLETQQAAVPILLSEFAPEQLQILTTLANSAEVSSVTWRVILRAETPELWASADVVSRLDLGQLSLTDGIAAALRHVANSALDAPRKLA